MVKKVLIHIFGWSIFIVILCNIGDSQIKNLLINVALLIILAIYLFPILDVIFELGLKLENKNNGKNLYIWADSLNGGEKYLMSILKNEKSRNLLHNLVRIKENLLHNINNDIKKLRLLRAYFKAYKNRKASSTYYKTIGAVLLSFIVFVIQAFIQGRIKKEEILLVFDLENAWGLIISLFLVAIYFILLPHRGENRLELILNIIEECIEELEKSNKGELRKHT